MTDSTLNLGIPEPAERRCGKCGQVRPLAMFYLAIEARQEHRMHCRVCQKELNDARKQPRRDYLDRVKLEAGCADCGLRSPYPEVYDFDHLPGAKKVQNIALFAMKGTFEDMVAEVAKCEVICSNCHRIRTRARGSKRFGVSR